MTLEQAIPLLAERLAKTGGKPPAKGRKTSFRQPAAKPAKSGGAGVAEEDAAPLDPQARGGEPEAPAPQDQEAGERDMSKEAVKRAAAVPTVQLENERVKVTEWRFAPGAATGWHRHGYDYVVVPMTTGRLQLEDGKETHFGRAHRRALLLPRGRRGA